MTCVLSRGLRRVPPPYYSRCLHFNILSFDLDRFSCHGNPWSSVLFLPEFLCSFTWITWIWVWVGRCWPWGESTRRCLPSNCGLQPLLNQSSKRPCSFPRFLTIRFRNAQRPLKLNTHTQREILKSFRHCLNGYNPSPGTGQEKFKGYSLGKNLRIIFQVAQW